MIGKTDSLQGEKQMLSRHNVNLRTDFIPAVPRTFFRGLLIIAFCLLTPSCSSQNAEITTAGKTSLARIANPLIEQRADPWCFRHSDGYYYFTATCPEYDRIELRRADTVAGLAETEAKVIWRKHDKGIMGHHIWAPEIHYIDGKWYIYFAAGRAEEVWAIRIYVLECDAANPLEGRWTEKGQIKTKWESFSLDATTFEHRGTRYLVWTQKEPEVRGTNLYIAKMDSPWSITGRQTMITKPEYPWEKKLYWVNEGPAALIRNGRVFISYSASGTNHNYCMGLLSADEDADLLDPNSWKKSSTPVFKSSEANSQYGPGHNSFTVAEDGRTDLLVYHARNYKKIQGDPLRNPDRHTRVQAFGWNPDGTPDFDEPVPNGPLPKPATEKKLAIMELVRKEITDTAYLPNDYGFLIMWIQSEKPNLFLYNKPENKIYMTKDFSSFLAGLEKFPDRAKVDRIRGCGISALGMSEKDKQRLEQLIKDKNFHMTGVDDGNFGVCSCQTSKVLYYTSIENKIRL